MFAFAGIINGLRQQEGTEPSGLYIRLLNTYNICLTMTAAYSMNNGAAHVRLDDDLTRESLVVGIVVKRVRIQLIE